MKLEGQKKCESGRTEKNENGRQKKMWKRNVRKKCETERTEKCELGGQNNVKLERQKKMWNWKTEKCERESGNEAWKLSLNPGANLMKLFISWGQFTKTLSSMKNTVLDCMVNVKLMAYFDK